ncbi:hypothetical protein SAMD00079811_56440 [Scytonema sp. HK-05]|nr:hypothetical protein SAMD00079811_56440 [Scytonema sp. HK-05]
MVRAICPEQTKVLKMISKEHKPPSSFYIDLSIIAQICVDFYKRCLGTALRSSLIFGLLAQAQDKPLLYKMDGILL